MKEQHFSIASSPVAMRTDAARIYIDTDRRTEREKGTLQDGRCGYDRSWRRQKSDHHCQPSHNM